MTDLSKYSANLFILSAPSGAGKTCVAKKVIENVEGLEKIITCTTRQPRSKEKNNIDYKFLSYNEFTKKAGEGKFLEVAHVHNDWYGCLKSDILDLLEKGIDILLIVDVQGAIAIQEQLSGATYIFLLPPSWEELENRLKKRDTDKDIDIELRLCNAKIELTKWKFYDYLVVNDILKKACLETQAIILAKRCETNKNVLKSLGVEGINERNAHQNN